MLRVLFTGAIAACLVSAAPVGEVVTFGNFIHNVASLEKSGAFYHDALGLDLQGQAPIAQRKFALNAPVAKLYGTPDTEMRGFTVRLPDSPGGLEFNEFKDSQGQQTVSLRVQDPGATILILKVKDLAGTLAKVKDAGGTVVTPGGPAGKSVLVKDPDGFYVELTEPEDAAANTAAGNVIAASLMISANNLDETVHLYRDMMGIPLTEETSFAKDKGLSTILGVGGSVTYRHATGAIPGTVFQVDFVEFKGIDRKLGHIQSFDRGSSNLRVRVKDYDAYIKSLTDGGVKIASSGGAPIQINANTKTCILADPNNFFFQIMSAAPPAPALVAPPAAPGRS